MAVLLGFAFVSGIITILSPCILPVLPIVLAGSAGGGRARPFGVVAGFVVSFTVFTLTLTAIVGALGISADALRFVAVGLIVAFGLVMIVPKLRDRFEIYASKIASLGGGRRSKSPESVAPQSRTSGFLGGLPIGFSLGLVWTPCVGPIMASVISLALTQQVDGGAVFITLAYTLGTAIPMLAVMLGGRALLTRVPFLTRNVARIQKGFGVLMIVVGVGIGFGWDRQFQATLLRVFPNYGAGLTAIENAAPVQQVLERRETPGTEASAGGGTFSYSERPKNGRLSDFGLAPDIVAKGKWFNTEGVLPLDTEASLNGSPPLVWDELRGRVVIVDFWTFSCVNCVRTIPYLKRWHDTYKDQGLVIIGVHTPEFEFEKNPNNVARAIADLGVDWPVVLDNDYAQWRSYSNRYWPAHYFIDAEGRVRYFHFGEGAYDASERVIRALLKEAGERVGGRISNPKLQFDARTPETYLGYGRARGFTSAVGMAPNKVADYRPSGAPANGEWNLSGQWIVAQEFAVPQSSGALEIGFHARNVFLVIEPEEDGGRIEVQVDGLPVSDTADVKDGILLPDESRLYQLVGLEEPGEHVLHLDVKGKLRLFAFTFG
jgi:cytochrome c biogenesis protein CcdA/thiol-disulfide isomerase/thioredoxin